MNQLLDAIRVELLKNESVGKSVVSSLSISKRVDIDIESLNNSLEELDVVEKKVRLSGKNNYLWRVDRQMLNEKILSACSE